MESTYRLQSIFFFLVFAAVLFLVFSVLKPYLVLLATAAAFAVALQPVYRSMQKFFGEPHRSISAFATVLITILIVLLPLGFFGTLAVEEATQLYSRLVIGIPDGITENIVPWLQEKISDVVPFARINVQQGLQTALQWFVQHIGPLFAGALSGLFMLFVGLMALYYFLKNGKNLVKIFLHISPLPDTYDQDILHDLRLMINSVLHGQVTIAIIQGILSSIGFAIFGLPNAALWGSLAAFAALIPGVGTSLVLVPSIIYLFISGHTFSGVGLLVWGTTAVGLIDNILGPILMGRGVRVHSFLILLSILGGLEFFGAAGILLGPLTISLLFSLTRVYTALAPRITS